MANRGFVGGLVTYGGTPVAQALVGIRSIIAHSESLYYWNHRWSEDQMYSKHIHSVYTDKKGRFLIPFNWAPTDIGIVADRSDAQVSVQATHPKLNLSKRKTTSLRIGSDWIRQSEIVLKGAYDELGGRLVPEGIKIPTFWGTDTPSYSIEILWAVGGVVIELG